MKKIFKTITALILSAAVLAPAGNLPLTMSAAACEAEHVCDDHCGEELKSFELEEYAASTLKAPTASKKSGTISCTADSASIKLTAAKGATIYYSLNDADYKKYTGAIKLTKNSTIETYAKSDGKKSKTVTYTYKLTPSVKFSATDTSSGKNVKLTTKVSGVKLYYTTDGSKPTTKSKLYTSSGITLTKSCQLRVLAVKSGWSNASFSKNYTVNSSTGTSSSSSDTKQLGESGFTKPVGGKGTVRYKGSTKDVYVITNSYNDYDKFYFSFLSGESVEFYIASGAKFNTGDTLTLSDMSGVEKGSGKISLSGFGLRSGADYISTDNDAKSFDKVELKAVSVDYTGSKYSQFYFYILAHDESGKKISLEGLVNISLTGSKHTGGADTRQLGASSFTAPSTGKAVTRYNGASRTDNAKHENFKDGDVKYDSYTISLSYSQYVSINIASYAKFSTGDTLTLSDMNGFDKGSGYVYLRGFDVGSANAYSYEKSANVFDKVEIKAVDMDYTGKKPSTIYFYILAHDKNGKKISFEGLAKVEVKYSSHGKDSSSGTGSGSGSGTGTGSGTGSGSTSSGTGSSSSKTSYTSDITGNTFDIPDECRANISYDGTEKTVPARFSENTPTKYANYDTNLSVYLDGGTGDTSTEYILFMLTADGWKAGTKLELGDLKSDENYMSVRGFYRYYLDYVGSYNEHIFTKLNPYYFDDVRFTVIDTDSSVDVLKYYFYVKIHDSSSSHTIEGVVNVRRNVEPTPTADVSTGGGSGTTPSNPSLNICPTCRGTGNCSYCNGRRSCPVCNGRGGMSVPTYGTGGSGWVNCASCNGLKTCKKCGGSGKCQTCGGNLF